MPDPTGLPASWTPLFEALPQGVLLLDQEGRYLEANAAALKLLDIDRQSLLANRLGDGRWDILAPDGSVLPLAETPGALALRTGRPVQRQVLGVVKLDGDVLWLEISAEPTRDGGALITFDDITRHHLAESILASRTRIAELAATATLEQILRATLDEAERLTGSSIGFYHFMEADQRTLTLQAWSTRTESEFCHAEGHGLHYAVDKAGVWVDAVHARKPVIHNDYASLPHRKGMPKGHATVLRELVVPVLREERIVALLGVGNKPFPYGHRDLQTVQRLADLAWDIAERKRYEVALHQSEADYRTLFERMAQGAFRQRADGSLIEVNSAALELFGLSRDEFLGRTSLTPAWDVVDETGEPIPGDDHPSMRALRTGKPVLGQVLGVANQHTGARVWAEVNAIPEFRPGDTTPYRVMVTVHDLTERRRLEASLQESEARWHTLIEQAGDGLELLDENGRYLQVNEASCRALGYTREELLGLSVLDTDPHITLEGYRAQFTALVGQPAVTFETTHRRKDGTQFPAEVTVSVIRMGDHHRALAQVRDISERAKAGETLRAAKELLNQTLDSLEAHVAVLDSVGNIIAVNEPWRCFARANGIRDTVGTVEQVNYLEVLASSCLNSAGDTADIRQGLVDVLSGHRPSFVAEYPCDSPTEPRWFRMHIRPLLATLGGAVITHEDITEETLAQQALVQAQEQLAFAQRSAGAGMWEWNLTSDQFTWSPELFRLYGLDPSQNQADAETWGSIVHPEDLKAVEAHTKELIAKPGPFTNDFRIIRPDGDIRWIHVQGAFDLDAQGRPIRAAGICLDHTLQKSAELALAASEAKARTMLQTARDGVWLIDPQGQLKEANDAACRMLGYPREVMLTLSVAGIEVQEDPEEVQQHITLIARQGWDVFESEHRRQDGSVFPVEVSVTHRADQNLLVVFVRDITDRKQAEKALQVSELRLRQAMGVAGLGIWEWDPRTDSTEWFGEMFSIYGIRREDFTGVGSDYMAFTRPDYRDRQQKNMKEAWTHAVTEAQFREGVPSIGDLKELCIVRPDGSEAYTLGSAICIVDASGQPLRMLGITLDITKRKAVEQALLDAEWKFRALFDNGPLGVAYHRMVYDEAGRPIDYFFIDANANYVELTGVDPRGRLVTEAFPGIEKDPFDWIGTFGRVAQSGERIRFEQYLETNGRWYDCVGYQYKPDHFVAAFMEITKRKLTELALQESEARFRSYVENAPVGVFICDETGRYLQVNPAASAITGYAEAELLGMHLSNLMPEDHLELATRLFEQVATYGKVSAECAFRRKDGRQGMWALESVRLGPNRFLGLVSDITEQKQAEAERLQLEQQVARTQKMESLGSLAGGVAHDMNNVLGAIMGLASIHQEQEPAGSRLRRSMDTILKACTRGRTLVKGLLGFARQGLEEVRLLDLNDVVREDVALLERTIPASIQLKIELADGLRAIHGDPSSLSHVLMNLCVNAIDAMPGGGVLRIRTRNLEPDEVELEVSDTGCGMPPEVMEKALDPFFTTKGQGKGTGLGLAIVYGTVKAHHGRLGLESKVGCGTRVHIQFPATLTEAVAELPAPQQPRGGPSLSLLVVDDDELIQESLSGLLHAMGHSAILAASGEEALQRLGEGLQVHCVMLDLNMPGLGGSGTLPLLRAAYPDLPVLLATGRADQTAMDLVARHARTLLLPKPFTTEEIASHLRQLGLG